MATKGGPSSPSQGDLTWVAPDIQAQITKRKWDALPGENQKDKSYLEEECIEWLRGTCPTGMRLQSTGEHQGPGWSLLYGWISCTHSDPWGPWLQPACPEENPSLPPSTLSRMQEFQLLWRGRELILGVPLAPRRMGERQDRGEDGMEMHASGWLLPQRDHAS
ncbi:hypothetical protein E2320_022461 [Naja naja]|nr:hypothetical protein E2320_022461 [Naja naja]